MKLTKFDAAEHLKSEAEIAEYLSAAMETGDPAFIADALGVIARARGMTQLARETGLTREGLYKTLSENGNPELGTIIKVLSALGLELTVKPATAHA